MKQMIHKVDSEKVIIIAAIVILKNLKQKEKVCSENDIIRKRQLLKDRK